MAVAEVLLEVVAYVLVALLDDEQGPGVAFLPPELQGGEEAAQFGGYVVAEELAEEVGVWHNILGNAQCSMHNGYLGVWDWMN